MHYPFTHNEAQSQFELELPDGVAFIEYFTEAGKMFLTHTEVPESYRNDGIATQLLTQTLGWVKEHQWTLVPQCAFVSAYVDNHSEWHFLLSDGYQM